MTAPFTRASRRIVHPTLGPSLRGDPWIIDSARFYRFSLSQLSYTRFSADLRIEVRQRGSLAVFDLAVDGVADSRRFTTFGAAARAGIAVRRATP